MDLQVTRRGRCANDRYLRQKELWHQRQKLQQVETPSALTLAEQRTIATNLQVFLGNLPRTAASKSADVVAGAANTTGLDIHGNPWTPEGGVPKAPPPGFDNTGKKATAAAVAASSETPSALTLAEQNLPDLGPPPKVPKTGTGSARCY